MLSSLRYLIRSVPPSTKNANLNLFSKILGRSSPTSINFCSKPSEPSSDITDVDIDKMMYEDEDFAANYNYEPPPQIVTPSNTIDGVIAPVDVNAWIDEELEKGGTVDMEYIENYKDEIQYPEPEERSGYYEFEGLKIWLPKKMLTPATYRYRLDAEDEQTLPDDIRICKFEKFKPTI